MADTDKFVPVFMAFEVNIQHLQNVFNEAGIDSIIRNDSQSALRGGFGTAAPGQAVILVPKSQKDTAMQIIKETFPKLVEEEE